MPSVVYFVGDQRHNHRLTEPQTDVGRGKACRLKLRHDPKISRIHCSIQRRPDSSYVLIDEASRNGTFLNGKPVNHEEVLLADGDVIKIGNTWLTFHNKRRRQESALQDVEDQIDRGHGFSTIMHNILDDA